MASRIINWRKFHPKPVLHIERAVVELVAYDKAGRIYTGPHIGVDPSINLPLLMWADITIFRTGWGEQPNRMDVGITHDAYVFGWSGKRLSSLPRHKYYYRSRLWLSVADRDFIYGAFTRGMF